jgi:peptidoglycan/LPS O-acetylase OafA/YrhL
MAEATVGRTGRGCEVRDDLTRGRGPADAGPRSESTGAPGEPASRRRGRPTHARHGAREASAVAETTSDGTDQERLGYQPALDGLRAVAVTVVVLFHIGFNRLRGGNIGVDVFFVLSGFLITTLLLRERRRTAGVDLRGFWARRARRLLPSLFVVAALVTVLFVVDAGATGRLATLAGVGSAVLYLSSLVAAFDWWSMGWMGHTWSLSVEEIFYAVFPLVVVLGLRRLGARWLYVLAAGAVAYYLVAADVWHWSGDHLYAGPDIRAEQLLIGCALAVALDRAGRRAWPVPWPAMVAAAAFLAGWVFLVSWTSPTYLDGGELLVALAAAVLVWGLMTVPTGWPARLLSAAPLVWVGRRSYTVYLVHYPLIGLLGGTGGGQGISVMSTGHRLVILALVAPLTLLYAGVSYRWIEARFSRSRSPGSAASA